MDCIDFAPFFWIFFISFSAFGAPLGLKETFQHALTHTEAVPSEETHVQQAEERRQQAVGRLLPNLSFSAGYLRQENATNATGASLFPSDQSTAKFTLLQPLFHGFGEFAEYRSRLAALSATEANREQAKLQLYQQVAKAFYAVLAARSDRENLKKTADLTVERVQELEKRAGIGRSRRSEVLAARTQLVSIQAQVEAAQQAFEEAIHQLHLVSNLEAVSDLDESRKIEELGVPNLSEALSQMEGRPDLRIQKSNLESASEQILVARAGHFPSLDFAGNYYLKRTGVQSDVKWDLGVQLTIPLFQGGATQAAVRESVEKEKDAQLSLSRSRRSAEVEVRSLHFNLGSQLTQYKTLQKALASAEENYREQTKDYRYGLVTNIDVIQALNTLEDSQRLADRMRYTVLTTYALLEAALGKLP